MKYRKHKVRKIWQLLLATSLIASFLCFGLTASVFAAEGSSQGDGITKTDPCSVPDENTGITYQGTLNNEGKCVYIKTGGDRKPGAPGINYCGDKDKNAVVMSIDIGCKHAGNAILDALFAIIRFITLGVSFIFIGSTVIAGIQFTASRGDPQATAAAMKRIASNASALLLFIFAYAILNWLVPNTILK